MAMIKCPECGKEFSSFAPACPGCAAPTEVLLKILQEQKQEEESSKSENVQKNISVTFSEHKDIYSCPACGKVNKVGQVKVCEKCGFPAFSFCREKTTMKELLSSYRKVHNIPKIISDSGKIPEKEKNRQEQRRQAELREREEREKAERDRIVEEARKTAEEKKTRDRRWKIIGSVSATIAAVAVFIFANKVIIPSMGGNSSDVIESNGTETSYAVESKTTEEPELTEWDKEYELLCNVETGDYVLFGTYEQDNDTSNGQEAIEWRVLAKEDGKILVISNYVLDCQPYNEKFIETTWENCTLRTWLNDTFYNDAFSSEEKSVIKITTVTADKNSRHDTDQGNNVNDTVFLLSITEANEYFTTDDVRQCENTAYAIAKSETEGNHEVDDGDYWLRTLGMLSYDAAYVEDDGYINQSGYPVSWEEVGVRPALWISLEQ